MPPMKKVIYENKYVKYNRKKIRSYNVTDKIQTKTGKINS